VALAEQWGIAKELWDRPWSLLSVGESQRISLAIAYGFNRAEVLMLDGAFIYFFSHHSDALFAPTSNFLYI
jgi:ABC-type Mn2+/Zn2+ transport system ATPase subunit